MSAASRLHSRGSQAGEILFGTADPSERRLAARGASVREVRTARALKGAALGILVAVVVGFPSRATVGGFWGFERWRLRLICYDTRGVRV
jgi:hypothetical protein